MAGEHDVVVLEEHDARLFARQADDSGDDVLAGLVGGVGLAGEENLHGSLRAAQQLGEARPVTEQEIRALVRRKSASEADRERVQVELVRCLRALLRQLEQPPLELAVDVPQLTRGDLVDRVPPAVGRVEVPPVGADEAAQQRRDLGRHPRRHVHAVGDGPDGDLRLGQAAPRVLPDPA